MKTVPCKFSLIFATALAFFIPALAFAQAGATAASEAAKAEDESEANGDAAEASESSADSDEPEDEGSGAEASQASDAPAMDGETYRVRLRDLEQRVDELKEQIRRSHTRLSLLSDTILSGASGGARAEIEFVNDLSGAWHVVEAVFVLDGAVQYKKTDDTGVLAKQKRIPIFSGSIPTGDHTLQVLLKLRGHGFGVFSYLRGMEANLTTDHSFTVTGGKVIELDVTAWEKGGPTTPVEQQPDIRFQQKIRSASETPKAAPLSSGSSDSPSGTTSVKTESSSENGKVGGGLSVGGSSSKK